MLKEPRIQNSERLERLRQIYLSTPLTSDHLAWMHIDLGEAWLHAYGYTGAAYDRMRDSPYYWAWVRSIFGLNDLLIMSHIQAEQKRVTEREYYQYHRCALLEFYPNSLVMQLILKHKKQDNAPTQLNDAAATLG